MANKLKILVPCAIGIIVAVLAFSFRSLSKDEIKNMVGSTEVVIGAGVNGILQLQKSIDMQMTQFLNGFKNGVRTTRENQTKFRNELDSMEAFLNPEKKRNTCTQKGCTIFAEIIKSTQQMFLYVDGEIRDTFDVSTGMTGFETPEMDLRPRGPMHTKYTSTKYPGGNYKGLGNMPYVVFIKGPYGIHGTTQGNITRLGKKASHGCIRLHPDNALVFFELVKLVGLENTWVSVREYPRRDDELPEFNN